jgi:hypothetical protein
MIEGAPLTVFGPYDFELSDDETREAAGRAGLRLALSGRLWSRHLAPLAAFVLALAFSAILTLTGLIGRRLGETLLLLSAGAYMISRIAARWRMREARQSGRTALAAMQKAGRVIISIDVAGLTMQSGRESSRWSFGACTDAEIAGSLLYVWPAVGAPAPIPTRVLGDSKEAERILAFLQSALVARKPVEQMAM